MINLLLFLMLFRPSLTFGECLNNSGDGRIYTDSEYNYISYRDIAAPGEHVATFQLMNPTNNYCDDTIFIADLNLDTKTITIR